MQLSFTVQDLPRKELFTMFRAWASWPGENIVQPVKVAEQFTVSLSLPNRELYDLDGIYLASELLINDTPTTHACAFFPLAGLLEGPVESTFTDYHTPNETPYSYGKLTAVMETDEQITLQTAPFLNKEEMVANATNWCKQRTDFWKRFTPINKEVETVVMNHFMTFNGIPLPPGFYVMMINNPFTLATLRSCITYSLYVWQMDEMAFINAMKRLGKTPLTTWNEFVTYNAFGFALELIAIGIIYHADEDIDLRTGKIEPTERMEMFVPTRRSDCEEKGLTINRVYTSFVRQARATSDPLLRMFVRVLRYYMSMLTTNSTNDAALDKNNQLQTTIQGTSYDGHVTGLFIPATLFFRRHPLLPHAVNYEDRISKLRHKRPHLEVLFMEGTGYQSALMNTFSNYMGADGKRCMDNITRVTRLLQASPLSKVLSTFIFNVRPCLDDNETPNGFIRFVTSAYVCDLDESGVQRLSQMEYRPFVEVAPNQLHYGATMKMIMDGKAIWVPSPAFDESVVRNVIYWSEHFPRGVPFMFSDIPPVFPETHTKGMIDSNGCSVTMIQGMQSVPLEDLAEMDAYLAASDEFSHYDMQCIPMDIRSLVVVRVTPIVPTQKMANLQRWFVREFGTAPCLLMKWAQGVPHQSTFTLTLHCRATGEEYDVRLALTDGARPKMENCLHSLLTPSMITISFADGISMVADNRSIAIPAAAVLDVTLIERKKAEQRTHRMESFLFNTNSTPSAVIDPIEKSVTYEEANDIEERAITIPYVAYEYVETVPDRWTYLPSENRIVVPSGLCVTLPDDAPPPTVTATPLQPLDLPSPPSAEPTAEPEEEKKPEEKKKPPRVQAPAEAMPRMEFRPRVCGVVQPDGSVEMDADLLVENIHTKHVYKFRNTLSLMWCFPDEFSVNVFCAEILPKQGRISFTFVYEDTPVIVEFHYTSLLLAPVVQPESMFERNAAGLYVLGVYIPAENLSCIYAIVDPLATLCGVMIDLTKNFSLFEPETLSFVDHADDITVYKNYKRPSQIITTLGRDPIECKDCAYDIKSGMVRVLLPSQDDVKHGVIWNCLALKSVEKTLRLQVTDDGLFVNGVLCGFPDNLMTITSTQPITEHQFAEFTHFTPELSRSGSKVSANFVQIGMHLFMSFNKTHMCLFDDTAIVLYLMDIGCENIARYDFSSSFSRFVSISGTMFTFDLDEAHEGVLKWRAFFALIYHTHLTIDNERADFLHYMNRFAEQVGAVCKHKYDFAVQVGSAVWAYTRSDSNFSQISQIADLDRWIHAVGRTWEDKMLLVIGIWITNLNNANYIGTQSALHAKYNIEIRNLRF